MKLLTTYRALLWVCVACILCLVFALKQMERRNALLQEQLNAAQERAILLQHDRQWDQRAVPVMISFYNGPDKHLRY